MKNALLAAPLLLAGVAATAGCAGTSTPAASVPAPSGAPISDTGSSGSGAAGSTGASGTPASGTAPASAGTGTSASGTAACASSDLKASIGGGSGGGMSQNHTGVELRNTGSSPCTLYGYPGVSFVTGSGGQQVGPAAVRAAQASPAETTVTLAPGATASAPLDIADTQVFPASQCKPVPVRGLRVYPPGEKAALFIPMTPQGGACSVRPAGGNPMNVGYLQSGTIPANGAS